MKPATLRSPFLVLCMALALCACGDRDDSPGRAGDGASVDALPQPEGASGSVTGMPDAPGPGQVGLPSIDPDTPIASDGSVVLPPEGMVDGAGIPPASPGNEGEPTPGDAVAVVRDYYAAINGGDFDRAYAFWSDGGNASGQSLQQFANGFTDTTGISVQIGEPGRVDAGAGSRHIEVPVAIDAKQRDGSMRQFVGAYVLRRTVVDGASAEQRLWRIVSADLREVRP
jgi:hypothetical protein